MDLFLLHSVSYAPVIPTYIFQTISLRRKVEAQLDGSRKAKISSLQNGLQLFLLPAQFINIYCKLVPVPYNVTTQAETGFAR